VERSPLQRQESGEAVRPARPGLQVGDRETTNMEIDPELEPVLEKRGIKTEDIHKIVAAPEGQKNSFKNTTTGHFLVYSRPSHTTYWVEYGRENNRYRIYRAYSHRMEVLEGFNLPAKVNQSFPEWLCTKCGIALELATVKLTYLEETFAAETPACPSCQRVLVREDDAVKKMALAEKMLEDK